MEAGTDGSSLCASIRHPGTNLSRSSVLLTGCQRGLLKDINSLCLVYSTFSSFVLSVVSVSARGSSENPQSLSPAFNFPHSCSANRILEKHVKEQVIVSESTNAPARSPICTGARHCPDLLLPYISLGVGCCVFSDPNLSLCWMRTLDYSISPCV